MVRKMLVRLLTRALGSFILLKSNSNNFIFSIEESEILERTAVGSRSRFCIRQRIPLPKVGFPIASPISKVYEVFFEVENTHLSHTCIKFKVQSLLYT